MSRPVSQSKLETAFKFHLLSSHQASSCREQTRLQWERQWKDIISSTSLLFVSTSHEPAGHSPATLERREQGGGQAKCVNKVGGRKSSLDCSQLGKCLQETLLNEASIGSSEMPILELAVPLMWASVRAGPASLCSGPLTPLRGSLGQDISSSQAYSLSQSPPIWSAGSTLLGLGLWKYNYFPTAAVNSQVTRTPASPLNSPGRSLTPVQSTTVRPVSGSPVLIFKHRSPPPCRGGT